MSKGNLDDVINNGQLDPINQAFHDGAQLVIRLDENGKLYGQPFIQLGLTRFYFSTKSSTTLETIKIFELPYDGWEKSVSHLNINEGGV